MPKANVYDLISEIEDMCECSICCDKYNDIRRIPRVLPCQHTFCTNCLSKQCRRQRLKCPLCNQEHSIKNGEVDTLPKDYTRNDLNGLLKKNILDIYAKNAKITTMYSIFAKRAMFKCAIFVMVSVKWNDVVRMKLKSEISHRPHKPC